MTTQLNLSHQNSAGSDDKTHKSGLPATLIKAIGKKYGIQEVAALDEIELKIAGAIAQAGIENSRGTFTTPRQKACISFLEN